MDPLEVDPNLEVDPSRAGGEWTLGSSCTGKKSHQGIASTEPESGGCLT